MKRRTVVLAIASLVGCASVAPPVAPLRLTVLHTNDHHGHFWRNDGGGLAARKTLIDSIRTEVHRDGGHVLLLDAGDINTGVPESDQLEAEPDFRGMSMLGYDAMAVGNHEFDKPQAVQERQRQWSSFPWLSANVRRGDAPVFTPYKVFALGATRVAVVGLTSEETARSVGRTRYPGMRVDVPADSLRTLMPELRRQADVVIALTHMGHYLPGQRGTNAPGDVELAKDVPGIDLIVGGHSHDTVCMEGTDRRVAPNPKTGACVPDRRHGTWIVQAGDRGRYLGRADFEYAHGEFRLASYRLLPVDQTVPEDASVLSLLHPFQQRGHAELSVVVGRAQGRFHGDRAVVRHHPAALGRLITAAMLERTGADVAVISGGGIRNSLSDGPIILRDLLKVQPFGGRVVTVTMTGAELQAYLEKVKAKTPGSGAYAQIGARSAQALNPEAEYRLATTGFLADGGDGYPPLPAERQTGDARWTDVDVLREYIAARGTVAVDDHRP